MQIPNVAPNGKRHEDLLNGFLRYIDDNIPPVSGGGEIEKNDLIGPLLVTDLRIFHRIARVPDIDEVHPLYDSSPLNIKTGNDPLASISPSVQFNVIA